MSRVVTLSLFFTRDLFRSLWGVVPPALGVVLYWLTFYYAGTVDYFAAVGGMDLALVCLVTTLLLADRANRATTYPLLARLPHRGELLAAIAGSALCVTIPLAIVFAIVAQSLGVVQITLPEALIIAPRWLALFVLVTTIGLHLSRLASRGGSYLVAYLLLGLSLTVSEQQRLLGPELGWVPQTINVVTGPIAHLAASPVTPWEPVPFLLALGVTSACSGLLFALAVWLFRRKNLMWAE